MITTTCFQELTKKTKIKGLSPKSWGIIIFVAFFTWFILFFYSFVVIVFLYALLSIMEFLDEDIYEIIFSRLKINSNKFYA